MPLKKKSNYNSDTPGKQLHLKRDLLLIPDRA